MSLPDQLVSKQIDETNFRECAKRAIAVYEKDGRILDALVWSRLIALYEAALEAAAAAKPKRRAPLELFKRLGHVCTTEPGCLCSSSGQECCCIWQPGQKRCSECGAPIIAIDFETGERGSS